MKILLCVCVCVCVCVCARVRKGEREREKVRNLPKRKYVASIKCSLKSIPCSPQNTIFPL